MFNNVKAVYLKKINVLQKRLSSIKFFRSRAVQATCFCLSLFCGLLLLFSIVIFLLYIKFFKLRCQANMNLLKEVMASFPTMNSGATVYSFPSHSAGLFEFSGGQLKVNTTLYAW